MQSKILIVEDDPNIASLIELYLQKEGYKTQISYNGREALSAFTEFNPDLMLLDIMLPEMNGYDICREIRKQSNVPIIMLTAKTETFDKVLGLELGADDYIVKPFEPKELLARVKAVMRRYNIPVDQKQSNEIIYTNLKINPDDYSLIYRGELMEIPPKEFELLTFLAKNPNQVFTREQLLDHVWGYDYYGETRTVDVHIKRLREKFSDENDWQIKTVWSVGYKFTTN
jgi:DNA-binding response OmpR family regulator